MFTAQLFRSRRAALMAGAALALSAAGAHAQAPAADEAAQVEQVIVTGTRLTSAGFQAPTPVTVLGSDALQRRAPSNLSEAINELPAFRLSSGPTQSTRGVIGSAQYSPDLRGLGAARTLMLVDGRRYVSSSSTFVGDMAQIPTSLVERVDIVTGGASAAYGSDAVAGVVNFILNDKLVGVKGGANYGVSGYGDAIEKNFNLAYGARFADDKAHFIIGGDIVKLGNVYNYYQRPWNNTEPGSYSPGATRAAGVPAQVLSSKVELIYPSGSIVLSGPLKGTAFMNDGTPYQFQYGAGGVFGQNMVGGTQNYGRNAILVQAMQQPTFRQNGLARLSYDVSPDLTLFAEINAAHTDNKGSHGDTFLTTGMIVPITNPFIPASVRARMQAAGVTSINLGRFNDDFTPFQTNTFFTTARAVAGARGRFLNNWNWEAYYQHGQTTQDFQLMVPDRANMFAAMYVVADASGNPVCGPLATNPNITAADALLVEPGCVPFNMFGQRNSQAAIDYITNPGKSTNVIKQDVVSLSFNGSAFDLPAGEVSLAFGGEMRKDSIDAEGDARSKVGALQTASQATFAGSGKVKEAFAEVGVPLLKDMPGFLELGVNGAIRRTDYQVSGAVTTWKVGATWRPTDFLRLRATQSRDIRAPNLTELFSTGSTGGQTNVFNPFNNQIGRLSTGGGGNPNLKPEVADSFTAGAVFQPKWGITRGLNVSVDYYRIKIDKVIASISATDVLARCFAGEKEVCTAITFDNSAFGIFIVKTSPLNLAQRETAGWDIEVSYRVPMASLPWEIPGQIDLRSLTNIVDKLTTTDRGVTTDRAGFSVDGTADLTGLAEITYTLNRFSGSLQARYFGEVGWDAALVGPDSPKYDPKASNSVNRNVFPGQVKLNLNASYDLIREDARRLQVFATINNLLDQSPSILGAAVFNLAGTQLYDNIGRYYRAGFRFNF